MFLVWLFLGIWVLALGATLWGTWCVHKGLSATIENEESFPPLSILKPIKGFDPGLEKNLLSFFELDYPKFEILFCLESSEDDSYPLVQQLCELFPWVATQILFCEKMREGNPKVSNLLSAYEVASHDVLLISDSNVRVSTNYLKDLIPTLSGKVGMVTSVVAGTGAEKMGGHLESTYLNTFYARWMFLSAKMGFPTVVGKSMLFRKSTARRFGGIETLLCYIAEDYMAGRAMVNLGLRVAMAKQPIHQHIGKYEFSEFWSRHIRWGRIRKSHAPLAFLIEPFFCFLPSGILGALALKTVWSISPVKTALVHLLVWLFSDLSLIYRLSGLQVHTIFSWLLRELLAFPQWCHVALGNTVKWRGRVLTVAPGGYLG